MTPMIDVVFQLLIFFICTASFQQAESLLPMGLATANATKGARPIDERSEQQRIVVRATRIDGQTQWIVNDRPVASLRELENTLRAVSQTDRSIPITLDVSNDVPLGDMIDVYDLSRLAGLTSIEFAVKQNISPQRHRGHGEEQKRSRAVME
jgi:biopolymer transport protein ExbD